MKFSGGWFIVIVAIVLVLAMVVTLLLGGNRSRHGYGYREQAATLVAARGQVAFNSEDCLSFRDWH